MSEIPMGTASAVIVAAGGARRMGFDKLLAELGGEPVLVHAVRAFLACPEIGEIIVVTDESRAAVLERAGLRDLRVVPGGSERHLSVWNGLQPCSGNFVAVHDGARPLVTPDMISRCLAVAAVHGAAALAKPVTDTLKRADASGRVTESVSRDGVWAMETPQAFRRADLLAAYRQIIDRGEIVTDEVSALQAAGFPVHLVENPMPNLKITFPADLKLAEQRWRNHLTW